jgi:hypothetical protein
MTLRLVLACLAALTLAGCDDTRRSMTPASVQAPATTMPPVRSGACADSALVDEKCTQAWYSCSAEHSVCVRQWNECCRK